MSPALKKLLNKKEITVIQDAPLLYSIVNLLAVAAAGALATIATRHAFGLDEIKFSYDDRIKDEDEEVDPDDL